MIKYSYIVFVFFTIKVAHIFVPVPLLEELISVQHFLLA